jgi:hypothetical protein
MTITILRAPHNCRESDGSTFAQCSSFQSIEVWLWKRPMAMTVKNGHFCSFGSPACPRTGRNVFLGDAGDPDFTDATWAQAQPRYRLTNSIPANVPGPPLESMACCTQARFPINSEPHSRLSEMSPIEGRRWRFGRDWKKCFFCSNDRLYRRSEVLFCSNDRRPLSSPMFTERLSFEIKSEIYQIID